jgi:hypothetical protein
VNAEERNVLAKQWLARQDDRLYQIAAPTEREAYRIFVRFIEGREIGEADDPGDVNLELFEIRTLRPGKIRPLDSE